MLYVLWYYSRKAPQATRMKILAAVAQRPGAASGWHHRPLAARVAGLDQDG